MTKLNKQNIHDIRTEALRHVSIEIWGYEKERRGYENRDIQITLDKKMIFINCKKLFS